MATRRQVQIFINGREVENTIKSITAEKAKLNRELNRMVIGSEEYERAIKDIGRLDGTIAQHRQKLSGIGSNWQSLTQGATKFLGVAGIAFGAQEIIQYGKQLYNTGVSMDTLARKANTVLGDSLGYVEAQAEKVASAMGLTNAEYVAAIANSADLLKPMGFTTEEAAKQSVQIQDLAGALSEWSGGKFGAIETTESLRKALLGEREELERYGVSIKQAELNQELASRGMNKLTGNSLKQAEAMVTLELITRKSADAIRGYSDNTDSAIRRQAELEAKIKNISERLATLLLPVFERLAAGISAVVDVVGTVVDGVEGLVDPAKSLTKEFDEQASTVENLEKNIQPLLDRYDELSAKANPSAAEQAELKRIIGEVSETIPSAVSAFGKYGEALSLNTDAAREFIRIEQARLKFVNQDAIAATENQIAKLDILIQRQLALRNSGGTAVVSGSGLSGGFKPFTDDELRNFDKTIEDIKLKVEGARAELARLKGDKVDIPNDNGSGGSGGGSGDPQYDKDKLAKEQEKAEKDRIAALEEGLKTEALLLENQRINKLITEQQYQEALYELEKSGLERRAELFLQFGEEQSVKALENQNALDELRQYEAERQAELDAGEIERLQSLDLQKLDIAKSTAEAEKAIRDEVLAYTKAKAEEELQDFQAREKRRAAALEEITDARLGVAQDLADGLNALGIENEAFQKGLFLFNKGVAAAEVIINLQREIASIAAANAILGPAGIPLTVAQTTLAKVRAGIGLATIAATGIIGVAKQKKEGGWATVQGEDDGQLYQAKLIGQPMTGLLNHPHPVLTSSGILANEIGKEYYVSHTDLRNPRVLDHVRAIENITTHRQRAAGGFASTTPTQNVAAAQVATDPELKQLLMMNAQFLAKLLSEGVRTEHTYDDLAAIKKGIAKLDKASGGRA